MVDVPPIEQIVEDWRIGMLATPPLACPFCNRLTRARYECQWCKKHWGHSELDLRRQQRLVRYSEYDFGTQNTLRQRGYFGVRVP